MQPIQITLRPDGTGAELIEIASGAFLGHQVGTMRAHSFTGSVVYAILGVQEYKSLEACQHAMVAQAYEYVAQQIEAGEA